MLRALFRPSRVTLSVGAIVACFFSARVAGQTTAAGTASTKSDLP